MVVEMVVERMEKLIQCLNDGVFVNRKASYCNSEWKQIKLFENIQSDLSGNK